MQERSVGEQSLNHHATIGPTILRPKAGRTLPPNDRLWASLRLMRSRIADVAGNVCIWDERRPEFHPKQSFMVP
jgi:hypothetical protein